MQNGLKERLNNKRVSAYKEYGIEISKEKK